MGPSGPEVQILRMCSWGGRPPGVLGLRAKVQAAMTFGRCVRSCSWRPGWKRVTVSGKAIPRIVVRPASPSLIVRFIRPTWPLVGTTVPWAVVWSCKLRGWSGLARRCSIPPDHRPRTKSGQGPALAGHVEAHGPGAERVPGPGLPCDPDAARPRARTDGATTARPGRRVWTWQGTASGMGCRNSRAVFLSALSARGARQAGLCGQCRRTGRACL